MANVFVKHCTNDTVLHGVHAGDILAQLGYGEDGVYITCNGKLVALQDGLQDGSVYHIIPRVLGGKGGFGSMLRAIGAQIEKTTNREACRDLSGRRMRDVNNEKQLRDWVAKAADREREKERKRRERLERRKAEPLHKFEDPTYHQQTTKVAENLDDALQHGLAQAKQPSTSGLSTRKRKAPEATVTRAKKACDWMGVDVANLSDLDSDSEPENVAEPHPGTPPAKDSGNPSPQSYQQESEDNSDSGVESVSVPTIKKCMETMDIDIESASEGQKEDVTPRDSDCSSMEVGSVQEVDSDTAAIDSLNLQSPVAVSPSRIAACVQPEPDGASLVTTGAYEVPANMGMLAALSHIPPADSKPSPVAFELENTDIDLMSFSSVEDLEALGLDNLKAVLTARGLKCGGTLQQRAERLWAVRGLGQDQIDPSLFAGKAKGKSRKK